MDKTYQHYRVWDLPTRCFHWINVICVILLTTFGLVMLYRSALGFEGTQAKIVLKTLHVCVGYVFALNLLYRLVWGFFGTEHNRWSNLFSFKGYFKSLKAYLSAAKSGERQQFIGHNPLGRFAVIVFYLFLVIMAVTGLVRAGTDIYYPPFGSFAASYVAKPGVSSKTLIPYDKTQVDAAKFAALGKFKHPFGLVHIYTFYLLMILVLLHIIAVIHAEYKEGGSLISAMFTGKKLLDRDPEDKSSKP